jgi:YidC/Oxa1 family membrane protein insertase
MTAIFHQIISRPLYNGLIFLMKALPFFDAGVIIIIFTIIIKLILLPLSIKASKAQIQMKSIEKDLNLIKEKYKDNKEEQSRKTMEYYKEKGVNPFASFFILIIQLPILIGLYRIFLKSGFPQVNKTLLYSFISTSVVINPIFLHFINISQKSIFLAVIAGLTTYFQVSISSAGAKPVPGTSGTNSDIANAMTMQMKYFFPVLMTFIAYTISSGIALYLITSNLFAIAQEYYIKKKYHKAVTVV